jgi:hypothetical protein
MAWHVFLIWRNGLYRQCRGRVSVQLKAPYSSDLLGYWAGCSTVLSDRELDHDDKHIALESSSDHFMTTLRVVLTVVVVVLFLAKGEDRSNTSLELVGNQS